LISKTLDHEFRGVVAGDPAKLELINSKFFRGVSSLKLMDEYIANIPTSFMIIRNHALIEPYNDIIGRLQDAGITQYWIKYEYGHRKNEKVDDFGPQVLEMNHLEVNVTHYFLYLNTKIYLLFNNNLGLLLRLHVSTNFCFYRLLL
jgi:hypothetical protein